MVFIICRTQIDCDSSKPTFKRCGFLSIQTWARRGCPRRPRGYSRIYRARPHANPASTRRAGRPVRCELEQAREQVAALIGAASRDVFFTSGRTESNNLAGWGARVRSPTVAK
ncbi:MAG: aminotransferase class V-fold PLP-dependent enzyme [Candidatus Binataceae bacterium]